jgi:hypothetical protein
MKITLTNNSIDFLVIKKHSVGNRHITEPTFNAGGQQSSKTLAVILEKTTR